MNRRNEFFMLLVTAFTLLRCGSLGGGEISGDFSHFETVEKERSGLEAFIAKDSKNHLAALGLGWVLLHQKDYPEAIAMFNRSLKISNQNPRAYMGLGIAYDKLGNYENSIKSYKEALKLQPNWYYAHYEMGKIYHQMGEKQSYFKELDTLVAKQPDLANDLLEIVYHQKKSL